MKTPKRTQNKRFVHAYQGDAITKAENWIREQRDCYNECAKIDGLEPAEFIIPDGVDKSVQTRRITMDKATWDALDAESQSRGVSESQLIQERLTASPLKEDRQPRN